MRRLLLSSAAVAAGPIAAANDPIITGHRLTPLTSWPGWFGPGPAGHAGAPGYYDHQYYGVPDGPGIQPGVAYRRFGGFGPGYFGTPGAAGSFWATGMSLYGPPIPTYAPVPGTFGAADLSRAYSDAPLIPAYGAAIGVTFPGRKHHLQPPLGWAGQYAPSPRHVPLTVSVHPPAVDVVAGPPAAAPGGQPCVRLSVCVPNDAAQVWIQNTPTTATGTERAFESPPLEVGKKYGYDVTARWTDAAGKEQAETVKVTATAGDTMRVAFGETAKR